MHSLLPVDHPGRKRPRVVILVIPLWLTTTAVAMVPHTDDPGVYCGGSSGWVDVGGHRGKNKAERG